MLKYSMDLEGRSFTYIYIRIICVYVCHIEIIMAIEIAGLINIVAYPICNFDGRCNVHTTYMYTWLCNSFHLLGMLHVQ